MRTSRLSFFRFNLDTDFIGFFTQGNPRAEEYHQLNQKYKTGEVVSILIEHEDSLLTKDNLKTVFKLQQQIEVIDVVETCPVLCLQGNHHFIDSPLHLAGPAQGSAQRNPVVRVLWVDRDDSVVDFNRLGQVPGPAQGLAPFSREDQADN